MSYLSLTIHVVYVYVGMPFNCYLTLYYIIVLRYVLVVIVVLLYTFASRIM